MTDMTTMRNAYLHQTQASGNDKKFIKRQVKQLGSSWGGKPSAAPWGHDWSALSRNTNLQFVWANQLNEQHRPEALATLNTPVPLSIDEFRRRLKQWRIRSATLHPSGFCPPRDLRPLEYIAALEYGFNPKTAEEGRIHSHVLLYNLRAIRLEHLARLWRELNNIKDPDEPLVEPYTPGPQGIGYLLKTLGSDVDMIEISPNLSQRIDSSALHSD